MGSIFYNLLFSEKMENNERTFLPNILNSSKYQTIDVLASKTLLII